MHIYDDSRIETMAENNENTDNIPEREKRLLEGYNKLEEILKLSQLVTYVFDRSVLNEIRYFTRAYVDVRLASSDEAKQSSFGRAEAALSAAFTDILDALVDHIKISVQKIRQKFINANVALHLNELKYKDALQALKSADDTILQSRAAREERFQKYIEFSNGDHYKTIVDFAFSLLELERRCELDNAQSSQKTELKRLRWSKEALENTEENKDKYKFELFVQPKIARGHSKPVGVEGLLRLKKPDSDFPLSPDMFLGAALKGNLGHDIALWVLNKAIETVTRWRKQELINEEFDFAINLSPSLAGDEKFNAIFRERILTNDVVGNISIEITEDWIIEAEEHKNISHCVASLPEKTRIAIDDFGTGSTKIEYIALIDGLTSIKIDKTLVDGLLTRNKERAKALISGIVSLAKSNRLKIVAEGVEIEEQKTILETLEVDELQGYFFSRPVSVEDFELKYFNPKPNTGI